ncbi:MAG TPA: thiamine pyrophosphate-dependent enzyme [Candidatus Dormibacteraeota bacterium]|nr:thiamine pyrophosphate-dependent enzyme [Candidatus Dormibacteraeota bacterium]
MTKLFSRPTSMSNVEVPYCPGCTHGIAHRLVGEVIDELGFFDDVIGVVSAGCSVRSWRLYRFDMVLAAHGRSPAVATGLKRALPENIIFAYQGDGDSAAIGLSELMHAALRCENITVLMINNAVYGATGGQAAPTTLLGQRTTSYVSGREPSRDGYPINMAEVIASISKNSYVARAALNNVRNIMNAKKSIKRAFETQQAGLGFSFVEMLSACPIGWQMTPLQSLEWIEKEMISQYPLGEMKIPKALAAK